MSTPPQPLAPVELRVALTTTDYARLVKFYCTGLGIEPAAIWNNGAGQAMLLNLGQATLELFDETQATMIDELEAGRRVSGPIRLALQVPDLPAALERLLAHGATLVQPPVITPWGDQNVRLQDPDGLQVTLFQPAPTIPSLETPRLRLRSLTLADAPFILELLNEPAFLRFIGDRGVRTRLDAESYLQHGPLRSYQQNGFGLYLVELKADQTPLGICGLIKRPELEDVDLGYALRAPYWAQGYATEATTAVVQQARTTLQRQRLLAIVTPDNERSQRVLARLGFTYQRLQPGTDGTELKVYALAL